MPTRSTTSSRRSDVSLLTEDRDLAGRIQTALDPNEASAGHVPFDLRKHSPPFDIADALDSDCLIVDSRLSNADRVFAHWKQREPEDRPALLLLANEIDAVPAGVPAEIDGIVPAAATTLLRRLVETVIDNRRLQEEVAELARFAALGRTLAGVLHELKNPLNNILGALDRVRSLLPADEKIARWNGILERNGALLRESLADLLDGFRFNLEPKPTPLHPLIDRAVAYAVAADVNHRNRIGIERRFDAQAPTVVGNAGQLLHVFLNILVNSRQAIGDENGVIIVTTRWTEDGWVEVEILDNGPGISEEVLPHLFKDRRSTKRTGSGFGLSLVRDVVAKHGGHIEASNSASGGACFRARFPAQPA